MKIAKDELISILSQFNPWWRGETIQELPTWERAILPELFNWIFNPPSPRAVLLSGARQTGKTTLLLQSIKRLIASGVSSTNIIYVTFDHPVIKLVGADAVLEAWRERYPAANGYEYVFLDEAQFINEWGVWVKHQVDFCKLRRIIFTGSSMPLLGDKQESGVGRWHTLCLPTMSFYEYLQLKKIALPKVPSLTVIQELREWPESEFGKLAEIAKPYIPYFHGYLVRGGFPQAAQIENVRQAQRLLREDIIDKALKRDMTALFGVRRVLELEKIFLYLCMHDGGLLDLVKLCENLGVKRPTAQHFIELLEATHLVYRLQPFGYGKDILRAKYKIYLADPAISSAVLLKGESILENSTALGIVAETAVFKHLFTRFSQQAIRLTYWRSSKDREVDLVAEMGETIVPIEVKYRTQHVESSDICGLLELCKSKPINYGYIVTKRLDDFGQFPSNLPNVQLMRIPALLLCYWLGQREGVVASSIPETVPMVS